MASPTFWSQAALEPKRLQNRRQRVAGKVRVKEVVLQTPVTQERIDGCGPFVLNAEF